MNPKTRRMLNVIDAFLVRNAATGEARELWDVLSALRGPDVDGIAHKRTTTIPIRRAAFPRTAKALDQGQTHVLKVGGAFGRPPISAYDSTQQGDDSYHFCYHADAAARALGLLTGEV